MSEPGQVPGAPDDNEPGGRLAQNVMHFGRVLRAAGLPIGPGRIIEGLRAVEAAGIQRRDDLYWALHSVFVNRRDQRELFDQAFHVFWRNPKILEKMMGMLLPQMDDVNTPDEEEQKTSKRLADAFFPGEQNQKGEPKEEKIESDAALTFSDRELLQRQDFESMSAEEVEAAKKAIARMRLPIIEVPTRRFRPAPHGRLVDMRATLRASLRSGGTIPLKREDPVTRHPPLVILCDISGSMSRYSRMFLHFVHAVTNDRDRVTTFLFGTRLTNVTRHLRQRDIDVAMTRVTDAVEDWSGGTRIGATLEEFNRMWARRVLGQGALVLFISDGLDRDAGAGLTKEIDRLHRSCRRLIWLNPLLRWSGFEPTSIGVRTILPHVDEFRPVHNLASLNDLAAALSHPAQRHETRTGVAA